MPQYTLEKSRMFSKKPAALSEGPLFTGSKSEGANHSSKGALANLEESILTTQVRVQIKTLSQHGETSKSTGKLKEMFKNILNTRFVQ